MTSKFWTPAPPKAYSITLGGELTGVGMNPLWDQVPGAWNIFATLYADLPMLLAWAKPPEQFPLHIPLIGHAVGTALQVAPDNKLVGLHAEHLTPAQFMQAFRNLAYLIPIRCFGEAWIEQADFFAAQYQASLNNVVYADFQGKRLLH